MLQPIETMFREKWAYNFKNLNFNILCKIAFWNRQKWLNKELMILSRRLGKDAVSKTVSENHKFHLEENF